MFFCQMHACVCWMTDWHEWIVCYWRASNVLIECTTTTTSGSRCLMYNIDRTTVSCCFYCDHFACMLYVAHYYVKSCIYC